MGNSSSEVTVARTVAAPVRSWYDLRFLFLYGLLLLPLASAVQLWWWCGQARRLGACAVVSQTRYRTRWKWDRQSGSGGSSEACYYMHSGHRTPAAYLVVPLFKASWEKEEILRWRKKHGGYSCRVLSSLRGSSGVNQVVLAKRRYQIESVRRKSFGEEQKNNPDGR